MFTMLQVVDDPKDALVRVNKMLSERVQIAEELSRRKEEIKLSPQVIVTFVETLMKLDRDQARDGLQKICHEW